MHYAVMAVAAILLAAAGLMAAALAQFGVVEFQPPARSYALVIGNDSYPDNPLKFARSDAAKVAEALKKYHGFEVDLAIDLKSAQMRSKIRDFLEYNGIHHDARLLIWYAGHGVTVKENDKTRGYLLPVDASIGANQSAIIKKSVDVDWLREKMRKVDSRHVMLVLDSCFAGAIIGEQKEKVTKRMRGPDVRDRTPLPSHWGNSVRQLIVAGNATQRVYDNGDFATVFIEAISGQSAVRTTYKGYLTGHELGEHIVNYFNINRKDQHPVSTTLPREPRDDQQGGQFIFGVKPVVYGGKWRIGAEPNLAGTDNPRENPGLVSLAQQCAVGRLHGAATKAINDVYNSTNLRHHTVIHKFEPDQTNPRTKKPVSTTANPVHSVELDGLMLRIRYSGSGAPGDNGEMLLLPMQDEASTVPDDLGNVLLQGAWARGGGTGCAEIRLNLRTQVGEGRIWLGLRNRFGVEPTGLLKRVLKEPLKSILKIDPINK